MREIETLPYAEERKIQFMIRMNDGDFGLSPSGRSGSLRSWKFNFGYPILILHQIKSYHFEGIVSRRSVAIRRSESVTGGEGKE